MRAAAMVRVSLRTNITGFMSGVKGWGSDSEVRVKVVTVMSWYAQHQVNQEDSEQNEVDGMKKGADSTGKVMHT